MTNQAQLRDLIITEITTAETLAADRVYSPGDWPSSGENMPIVLVEDTHEEKISETRAQPNFTVAAYFRVDARLKESTAQEAQANIDILRYQIEQAVIVNYDILKLVQQIKSVRTVKTINSDTGMHVAQVVFEFCLEFFQAQEDFDTTYNAIPLKEIDINIDLVNVADLTGTYPSPPFPDSVNPAPRTEGPDGRNEGFTKINLEQ